MNDQIKFVCRCMVWCCVVLWVEGAVRCVARTVPLFVLTRSALENTTIATYPPLSGGGAAAAEIGEQR